MKNLFSKIQSRKILILIVFLLIGLIFYFTYKHFSFKKIVNFKETRQKILNQIKKEEEKYKNDNYGATDPLKTYKLFLEALKNNDIDLAVKYFAIDNQAKYKELLLNIKKSGQWEKMMNDLLREENQKGEYIRDDWYNIKIKNERKEVVTTVVLKIIKDFEGKPVSNLWKIVEF